MLSAVDQFAGSCPVRRSISWRAGRARLPRRHLLPRPLRLLPGDVLNEEVME